MLEGQYRRGTVVSSYNSVRSGHFRRPPRLNGIPAMFLCVMLPPVSSVYSDGAFFLLEPPGGAIVGLFLSPLTHALSQERSGVGAYSFDDIINIAGRGRHTGRRAALWALPPSLLVEGDMHSGRARRALRIRDRSRISLPDTTSPNAQGSGSKMKQRNPHLLAIPSSSREICICSVKFH